MGDQFVDARDQAHSGFARPGVMIGYFQSLPTCADAFADALVSIAAFDDVGTAVVLLPALVRLLRPTTSIWIANAGLLWAVEVLPTRGRTIAAPFIRPHGSIGTRVDHGLGPGCRSAP